MVWPVTYLRGNSTGGQGHDVHGCIPARAVEAHSYQHTPAHQVLQQAHKPGKAAARQCFVRAHAQGNQFMGYGTGCTAGKQHRPRPPTGKVQQPHMPHMQMISCATYEA